MIRKLLIANRGEIACRIARTCRRLGIRTVAVYSAADVNALHVRSADEAVPIGAAAASDSYLNIAHILAAAKATGADALHPGYGFLSENAALPDACAAAGLVFVGPPASAMRAMGSKSEAKRLMAEARVPLLPGYHGADQRSEVLQREAAALGFPLLIKPALGGGGKGMRIVRAITEFGAALESCQREARASFGDESVLLERYLERPRHVEVQVFGDRHGNVLSLFDRDCSAQRRHQKIIEEAPAWGLGDTQRAAMAEAARAAARRVGYVGAGTVEFILAPGGEFYFMEMNTRLQVEHPVTEMITGLDLVEWQLRVAAGEPLPLTQSQVAASGAAIELRLYAERPEQGFLPSVGLLQHCVLPAGAPWLRVDTGVARGDEVTTHYDPMIAKLIVHAPTRGEAIARATAALAECQIVGVHTNQRFLAALLRLPDFVMEQVDTHLIEREAAQLLAAVAPVDRALLCVAAAWQLLVEQRAANASPWRQLAGWRLNASYVRELQFLRGEVFESVPVCYAPGHWRIDDLPVQVLHADAETLAISRDGRRLQGSVVPAADGWHVFCQGQHAVLQPHVPHAPGSEDVASEGGLTAPMSGVIVQVLVAAGASVKRGAPLVAMEAMKMEHKVCAPADGVVQAVLCAAGDQVRDGQALVEFQPA